MLEIANMPQSSTAMVKGMAVPEALPHTYESGRGSACG